MARALLFVLAGQALSGLALSAQELLDRVVARVGGYAITLTDVNAALELGVVDAPAGDERLAEAIQRMVERQLMLTEVDRFASPEPAPEAVDTQVEVMKARAGDRLPAVMRATGVHEQRIREMARETLRIEAYLAQRFGATAQVSSQEVLAYYRANPDEFRRNGTPIPFEEAEQEARRRAAAERRAATIAQWLRELRARVDVIQPRS